MERLDRGVVAVRKSSTEAFVSWRLLGLDPAAVGFNLYRSANGGPWVRLNASPLQAGTNFSDTGSIAGQSNTYRVNPVVGGVEQAADGQWTLPANASAEPLFRIPMQRPTDRKVHKVWVGDMDGDGAYEYVVLWVRTLDGQSQILQTYRVDGTLMWEMDFGPNSVDPDNIYPNAAAVAAGQMDGITVYDLDGDGRSEVIVKSADGVVFSDGTTLEYGDDLTQFISILDGVSGVEKARAPLPNPWKEAIRRPLGTLFGIGYPDGERPSLLIHAKNRNPDLSFNTIESAWDFRGGAIDMRWSISWDGPVSPEAGHQMRVVDLDGDGRDELFPGVHAVDDDGTLMFDMGDWGVKHGDRWQVGDIDPARPGQEIYGVQQNNGDGLREFVADAVTGEALWTYGVPGSVVDVGRGSVGDIDPRHPGMECWAFDGVRTAGGTQVSDSFPWPNLTVWWDGDLLVENLNENVIDKWNHLSEGTSRVLTCYHFGSARANSRSVTPFYGDIIGDWREEVIFEGGANRDVLLVFTTTSPTDHRLYTLAHNPAYRNGLTVKGYLQQNIPDYFLGEGMAAPPTPHISYTDLQPAADAPGNLAAAAGNSHRVDLQWQDNSINEYGFHIERSVDGGDFRLLASVGPDVTGYSDSAAFPGTLHRYRVAAFNGAGVSGFAGPESATTPAGPTAPPTGLVARVVSASSVDLSWSASPGATGYTIRRATHAAGPFAIIASGLGSTGFSDEGLETGTSYHYLVSSESPGGESDGAEVVATPGILEQDPDDPGLVVVEAEHADRRVARSGKMWLPVDEVSASGGRAMSALPDSGTAFATGYAASSPRMDYRVNFVRSGIHHVWVRGHSASGDPGGSDSLFVGIDGEALAPATALRLYSTDHAWENRAQADGSPVVLDVPTAGEHVVNIWMREDGATLDKILLTTDPSFTPGLLGPPESMRSAAPAGSGASVTPVPDLEFSAPSGLQTVDPEAHAPGTRSVSGSRLLRQTFSLADELTVSRIILSLSASGGGGGLRLRVFEVANVNAGSWSPGNQVHVIEIPTTTALPSSAKTLGLILEGDSVFTLPARNAGGQGYGIEISNLDSSTNIGAIIHTNDGVDRYPGGRYYDENGAASGGGIRDIGLALIPATPPETPSGLTGAGSDGSVVLEWPAVPTAVDYTIRRGTEPGGAGQAVVATGVSEAAFTDTGVINGTRYYYTVVANNDSGSSGPSNEVELRPLSPRQAWRDQHFGSIESEGDAADAADPDGDGSPNEDEFAAHTDPRDLTDVFRAEVTSAPDGVGYRVRFAAKAGLTYAIEFGDDPGQDGWDDLPGASFSATADGFLEHVDSYSGDRRFYRVRTPANPGP